MVGVRRVEVEERAYRIWLEAGAPQGSSLVHWLQAEIELGIIPRPDIADTIVTLPHTAPDRATPRQDERSVSSLPEV
jgi:hypothetical protein